MDRAPALTEGVRILELVAHRAGPMPLDEFADKIQMSRSSLKRLLNVLVAGGHLRRYARRAGYGPGPRLLSLAAACKQSWVVEAQVEDELRATAESLQMSVQYGMLDRARERIVVLHTVELMGTVHVAPPGTDATVYSHRHALTKMILALAEPGLRKRLIAQCDGESRTEHTLLPGPELDRVLEQAGQAGMVVDREELRPGLFRVAVPVCGDNMPQTCAVCATCFAAVFADEQIEPIARRLRQCAQRVIALWGERAS